MLATGKETVMGKVAEIIEGNFLRRDTAIIDVMMLFAVAVIGISTLIDNKYNIHNGIIGICVLMALLVKGSESYFYCVNLAANSIQSLIHDNYIYIKEF